MPTFGERLQHAWDAFAGRDPTPPINIGPSYSRKPDRMRLSKGNDRSIVTSVLNRIAIDTAQVRIEHVRLDEFDRYVETIRSGLNECLTLEANIDQTGRAFIQDVVMSMFDEGTVAIVPVETSLDPAVSTSYDIKQLRTGKIIEWYPQHVKMSVYNENAGKREEIILPKKQVAIVENPLYAIMNEPNSTLQRLMRKLSLLDYVDEQQGAGKLDLIIQLPYVIKSEARRADAERRRNEIVTQLEGSKYGIAYTDGTEHITQLNRSVDNQLLSQINDLTSMLYSQLGITKEIMEGTADEKVMNNYYNRTIEPILSALVDEMKRKFLTKTARTQNQSIQFFRDYFKLVSPTDLADLSDKLTRNEVMTSNEVRQIIGLKPSQDPNADVLRNKNIAMSNEEGAYPTEDEYYNEDEYTEDDYNQNMQQLDDVDSQLDQFEQSLGHSESFSDESLAHYASPYYDPVKAHQYYEDYIKKGRLKGRETTGETKYSTSMLNDQGKMAYKQIKESIDTEKKSKSDSISADSKAQIEGAKENLKSGIAGSEEQMNSEIGSSRSETNSMIEQHSNNINSQIEQIQEKISSGSIGSIDAERQIEVLRMKNARKRQELQAAFQSKLEGFKNDHKNRTLGLKESNKAEVAGIRSNASASKKALSEEYKNKAYDELKRLVDSGEFKKVSKKKKSK